MDNLPHIILSVVVIMNIVRISFLEKRLSDLKIKGRD